jgi:sarcosine oxidase subunit beta
MASVKLWERLNDDLGFDTEYMQGGNIRMAINEEHMAPLRREGEEELSAGLPIEIWDRDELRRRAPYLNDIFIGAKYCPTDGNANPLIVARAFGWAAERVGVQLMTHTEVLDIGVQGGQVSGVTARQGTGEVRVEAPRVILACGHWAVPLASRIGVELPILPVRHVLAVTERVRPPFFTEYLQAGLYENPAAATREAGIVLEDLGQLGIRPARDGHIHIGGVGTPGTDDQTASAHAVRQLARDAMRMIPSLSRVRLLHAWGRTIQLTPDELPIIDPAAGIGGLILAVGFSGHGFCLGPIVGKLLSELIVDGEPSIPLHEFRLSRFKDLGPSAAS